MKHFCYLSVNFEFYFFGLDQKSNRDTAEGEIPTLHGRSVKIQQSLKN